MPTSRFVPILLAVTLSFAAVLVSCTDSGTEPVPAPHIESITPDTAAAGDTIRIAGSGFGEIRGTSVVRVGGVDCSAYGAWSSVLIEVIIPANASSGPVTVVVGGQVSNGVSCIIAGGGVAGPSFAISVFPILSSSQYGCSGCHSGSGGIAWYSANGTTTYTNLVNGTANVSNCGSTLVTPGDLAGSVLYQRLAGTCSGEARMPLGGSAISAADLSAIAAWISAGAAP